MFQPHSSGSMKGNNQKKPNHGRGASDNPRNRFKDRHREHDLETTDLESPVEPETEYIKDASRSILTRNDSPDVGFDVSLNPYRGCEHGCIYCYARPTHETLGFSAGLDFESRIIVKEQAPELLREELSASDYEPETIAISGVTDPYQPIERKLELTRDCLRVLSETRHPAGIITKNEQITRDIDLLAPMAEDHCIMVNMSVTTLNHEVARKMEPRTSQPQRRLRAIDELTDAGIPVRVNVAPVIPGLTDHEIPDIMEAASEAGAEYATYVLLRLPRSVKDLFVEWLDEAFPARKNRVLNQIRSTRDGDLNDPRFHERMSGSGIFAEQIENLFDVACRQHEMNASRPTVTADHFDPPGRSQLSLFESRENR